MPNFVLEILANVFFYLAGSLGGRAMRQAAHSGKGPAAVGLTLLLLGAASAGAWFVDPNKTGLDFAFWTILYAVGFGSGWRRQG